jgi:hypothetical protein
MMILKIICYLQPLFLYVKSCRHQLWRGDPRQTSNYLLYLVGKEAGPDWLDAAPSNSRLPVSELLEVLLWE